MKDIINDALDIEAVETLLKTDLLAALRVLKDDLGSWYQLAHADGVEDLIPGFGADRLYYENDGDGNYMEAVVKFRLDGRELGLVRFTGVYSSWDSSEWDDELTMVHPRQVITTVYVAEDGSEDTQHTFFKD